MAEITVYGIPNCDTIKKTMKWFKKNKINFHFYDYKKEGIDKNKLTQWCSKVSWEILLNKKSTTWRSLTLPEQKKITNQSAAIKLMMENNSIIKRPVIEIGPQDTHKALGAEYKKLVVGFNEDEFKRAIKIKIN